MPGNQNPPSHENNTQGNSDNSTEKISAYEKSIFILINEIKDYITKQNTRQEEANDTNQKILFELIKRGKKKNMDKTFIHLISLQKKLKVNLGHH